ncbi:MAG: hypothetical protein ABI035_10870 [Gemmatimonadaceae bacterium]
MNMRHALLAIATLCITAASIQAQAASDRPRAKAAMWNALTLSESQQSRVKTIHTKYAPSVKAAQQQAKDSAARINDTELAEVRNILTSDQQQTFDNYMTGKKRAKRGAGVKLMPVKVGIPE